MGRHGGARGRPWPPEVGPGRGEASGAACCHVWPSGARGAALEQPAPPSAPHAAPQAPRPKKFGCDTTVSLAGNGRIRPRVEVCLLDEALTMRGCPSMLHLVTDSVSSSARAGTALSSQKAPTQIGSSGPTWTTKRRPKHAGRPSRKLVRLHRHARTPSARFGAFWFFAEMSRPRQNAERN